MYAINDGGALVINDELVPMRENDVVIIKRNELHTFYVKTGEFETYEIKFILLGEENDFSEGVSRAAIFSEKTQCAY